MNMPMRNLRGISGGICGKNTAEIYVEKPKKIQEQLEEFTKAFREELSVEIIWKRLGDKVWENFA